LRPKYTGLTQASESFRTGGTTFGLKKVLEWAEIVLDSVPGGEPTAECVKVIQRGMNDAEDSFQGKVNPLGLANWKPRSKRERAQPPEPSSEREDDQAPKPIRRLRFSSRENNSETGACPYQTPTPDFACTAVLLDHAFSNILLSLYSSNVQV